MLKKIHTLEALFIAIYFFEQLLLIVFAYLFKENIEIIIGIFPIVFLTTIAYEKLFIKYNYEKTIDNYQNLFRPTKKDINTKRLYHSEEQKLRSLLNHNLRGINEYIKNDSKRN